MAEDLVRLKVDLIVTSGSPAIRAAQKATTTIPIVMAGTGDPVGSKFVKSLAQPGGNITGLSTVSDDLTPKLLELLVTMVPTATRVAVLVNPDSSTRTRIIDSVLAASQKRRTTILPVDARTPQEIEQAFSKTIGALQVTRTRSSGARNLVIYR
jgi:putative tryptophan/tyrosine transport system substrate-binding protein